MKRSFIAMALIVLLLSPLCGDEQKMKDDFDPAPPPELPLTNFLTDTINPETGLWLASAGALCGMSLAAAVSYNAFSGALDDPRQRDVQRGVPLFGLSLAGTVFSAVLIDFFSEEIRKDRKRSRTTSEE